MQCHTSIAMGNTIQCHTLMIFNKIATNGPPITHVNTKDLILSVKKSIGVCLLNPCFFSIRKVEYYTPKKEQAI